MPYQKIPKYKLHHKISSIFQSIGDDDRNDDCNRISVPLENDKCFQLMSSVHCPYQHWVLLNRDTRKAIMKQYINNISRQ